MDKSIFFCDKLVRDKDPDLLRNRNIEVRTRPLDEEEYITYLRKKIKEEAAEVEEAVTVEETVTELIDVYEAAEALKKAMGLSEEQFQKLAEMKCRKRGSFDKKVCLCSVTMVQDHPGIAHYRKHPEEYPEKRISE